MLFSPLFVEKQRRNEPLKQANGRPQVVGLCPVQQDYHEHAWGKPYISSGVPKSYQETGKLTRRPGQGKKRSVKTPRLNKTVAGKILRNPSAP
ncbi:Hypothetical protein FKW44_012947 [Caligus rogercresseyi]|uniref:Uncharacterized protein n=1 Tax=Caligus rogercresseyi TaxID=217165 RepID=A0A7T8HKN8_CALRO|nr:Hypothetical protein FKW44_012947 [Caligus rogercresseyi]